jgi:hypothetical protein
MLQEEQEECQRSDQNPRRWGSFGVDRCPGIRQFWKDKRLQFPPLPATATSPEKRVMSSNFLVWSLLVKDETEVSMENESLHPPGTGEPKHSTQIISMFVGGVLTVIGLAGILFPAFGGLHLGPFYSFFIATSGVLLLYNGYKDNSRDAFLCCLGFCLFYGLHALLGWAFGSPGLPQVGYDRPDPRLLQIIPGFHEVGRNDHILNTILTLVLAGGAFDWWRRHTDQRSVMSVIREFIDEHRRGSLDQGIRH